ncbi:acyltransferase [Aestuariibacter halophilus]|uniref:Acyltransferase n=1 Tax=Fluctibacter halophilus TaxID=226011 RepID=A0ABS8GBS0_9ALTE|nr:acyltransferase [Aestuariibacter halophilus]MCC2617948.1 acyltransferase [Aestuariibacter halophilus]
MTQVQSTRRVDLDWLRFLAFCLLILYHVGMYYVADWGWHIKSPHQSEPLQDVMILSNQWRMSMLFFISAMALGLVSERYSAGRLLKLRSHRLLAPLLLGMLVIVPPQLFYELVYRGDWQGGYLGFLAEYYNMDTTLAPDKQSDIGLLTWNHLWFLPYLWVYTLIWIVLKPALDAVATSLNARPVSPLIWVATMVIGLAVIWQLLRHLYPTTHDLIHDWYSHAKYGFVFVCGYLLSKNDQVWEAIARWRWYFLGTAVVAYGVIIADRHGMLPFLNENTVQIVWVRSLIAAVLSLNHWAWILTLVGFAAIHLRVAPAWLPTANRAILPCYVLHQSVIIVLAVMLAPFAIPMALEAVTLILLTTVVCWLGFRWVDKTRISRWWFGLGTPKPESSDPVAPIPALSPQVSAQTDR